MAESNSRGTFGLAFLIGVQVLLSQHQQLPSYEGITPFVVVYDTSAVPALGVVMLAVQ